MGWGEGEHGEGKGLGGDWKVRFWDVPLDWKLDSLITVLAIEK